MKRSSLIWVAAGALSAWLMAACGSDDTDDPGAGGSAGSGAGGGSAGNDGGAGMSGSAGMASGGSGASGGAGGSAGMAGAAGAGGAVMLCPNDTGPEPNDSEPLASPACGTVPCELSDTDDTGSMGYGGPEAPVAGVVGPTDVDWYRYVGLDEFSVLETTNPTAKTSATDSGYRLCMFAACPDGTSNHKCNSGSVAMSPNGLKGCCVDAPGEVSSDHDCPGSPTDDDSAEVFIRVDNANACVTYSVDYHF